MSELREAEQVIIQGIQRGYDNGYAKAQHDLCDLLRKTRDHTPSARLAAVIAWAGDDLEQMEELARGTCRCGHGTKMHTCRQRANGSSCAWCGCGKATMNNRGTCIYTLDECPFDWCAVHDDLIVVEDKYYCNVTGWPMSR